MIWEYCFNLPPLALFQELSLNTHIPTQIPAMKEKSYGSEYPTLYEGLKGMKFIEKVVESHKKGNIWLSMDNQ